MGSNNECVCARLKTFFNQIQALELKIIINLFTNPVIRVFVLVQVSLHVCEGIGFGLLGNVVRLAL